MANVIEQTLDMGARRCGDIHPARHARQLIDLCLAADHLHVAGGLLAMFFLYQNMAMRSGGNLRLMGDRQELLMLAQ